MAKSMVTMRANLYYTKRQYRPIDERYKMNAQGACTHLVAECIGRQGQEEVVVRAPNRKPKGVWYRAHSEKPTKEATRSKHRNKRPSNDGNENQCKFDALFMWVSWLIGDTASKMTGRKHRDTLRTRGFGPPIDDSTRHIKTTRHSTKQRNHTSTHTAQRRYR